jgi:hypothetical protein
MSKSIIKITGTVALKSRRASELFLDNRFKPRIVANAKAYSRKGLKMESLARG